jgi:hypothetical protein
MIDTPRLALVLALPIAGALLACGAAKTASVGEGGAQTVKVSVLPGQAEVAPGKPVQFTAQVTGATNPAVTWALVESSGGTVDANGLYTAAAAEGTYHVRATSQDLDTAQATATVTVTSTPRPIAVAVSPTTGAINSCLTLSLKATVTGGSDPTATWSVAEAGGGTVSAAGLYTAPNVPGTYHVVAASRASPSTTARATVTVTDRVVSVVVNPGSVAVTKSGTATFSATVTTTCGAFQSLVEEPIQAAE